MQHFSCRPQLFATFWSTRFSSTHLKRSAKYFSGNIETELMKRSCSIILTCLWLISHTLKESFASVSWPARPFILRITPVSLSPCWCFVCVHQKPLFLSYDKGLLLGIKAIKLQNEMLKLLLFLRDLCTLRYNKSLIHAGHACTGPLIYCYINLKIWTLPLINTQSLPLAVRLVHLIYNQVQK